MSKKVVASGSTSSLVVDGFQVNQLSTRIGFLHIDQVDTRDFRRENVTVPPSVVSYRN